MHLAVRVGREAAKEYHIQITILSISMPYTVLARSVAYSRIKWLVDMTNGMANATLSFGDRPTK